MDITLARKITALQYEIDNLDAYAEELEKPEDIEVVKANMAKMNAQLDMLLVKAQRQELIERAQQISFQSNRGTR